MKRLSILWLALLTGSLCSGQNYPPARWVEVSTNWAVMNPTNSTVQGTLDFIDSYWLDGLYTNAWTTIIPTNTKVQGALNWLDENVGLIRVDLAAVSNAQNTINGNFTTISNAFVELQDVVNTNAWLSSSNAYIANWNQGNISNLMGQVLHNVFRSFTNIPGMSTNPAYTNAASTNFGWSYSWKPEGTNFSYSNFDLALGYVDLASIFTGWTTNYTGENFYSKQTNDIVIPVPLSTFTTFASVANAQPTRIMRNGATVTYQLEAGEYATSNGVNLDLLSRPFIGDYELIVAGDLAAGSTVSINNTNLNFSVMSISSPNSSKVTLRNLTLRDVLDNSNTNRLASLDNYGVASGGGDLWIQNCTVTNVAIGVSALRPDSKVTFASGTNKVYALKYPITSWAGVIVEQFQASGSLLLSLNPGSTMAYLGSGVVQSARGVMARGGESQLGFFLDTELVSNLGVGGTNQVASAGVLAVAGGSVSLGTKINISGRFAEGVVASFDGYVETQGGTISTVGAGTNWSSHAAKALMGGSVAAWGGSFLSATNGSPTIKAESQGTIFLERAVTNSISPYSLSPATNAFSSVDGAAIWIP